MYGQRPRAYAQIMTTPVPEPGVTLDSLSAGIDNSVAAEVTLSKELAAGRPADLDVAAMIKLQCDMASSALIAQALAAAQKDAADRMKTLNQLVE
jgi:hypothetical protein